MRPTVHRCMRPTDWQRVTPSRQVSVTKRLGVKISSITQHLPETLEAHQRGKTNQAGTYWPAAC